MEGIEIFLILMTNIEFSNAKKFTDLNKEYLLTLAVGYLGGMRKKIYTEEITVKALEWNPKEFSWSLEKYKKFPDKEAARRPLFNARDDFKLVTGAYSRDLAKDGWRLTKKGMQVFEALSHLLGSRPNLSKLNKKETVSLNKIIKSKKIFKEFLKKPDLEINTYELAEFLNSTPDNIFSIRRNFFQMSNEIEFLDNKEINLFFEFLKNKFPDILDETKYIQDQKVREKSKS